MVRPWPLTVTRDHAVAAALGLATFAVFWASPVQQPSDARYTLLVTESLLRTGLSSLEDHLTYGRADTYNVERVGRHLYYMPPHGGAVFSIPFVLALRPFGISALDSQGRYDPAGELRAQRIIASALMAALTVVFFRTARLLLPTGGSLLVALSAALGTQVWSTASRALWSDTWSIALLGYVVWRVAAWELEDRPIRPEVLATLLAAVFFARPTGAAHVLVVTGYVALCRRRLLPRLIATGAAWMAGFVAYSWMLYGRPLPSYYRFWHLGTSAGWRPLVANLLSPSRGLLVCVPLVPVVLYLIVRYRGTLGASARRLAVMAVAGVCGQFLILALWYAWWGGHSYGARLTTGTVPWIALLAAIALRGALDARRSGAVAPLTSRFEAAVATALVVGSVFIQARGALAHATQLWNVRPANVDEHPERVWDWRYPQWLAGLLPLPRRTDFPRLAVGTTLSLGPTPADQYLREGWSFPEEELRWSDASQASLEFAVPAPGPLVLRMKMRPGPAWSEVGGQRLDVELNGHTVARRTLVRQEAAVFAAGLGPHVEEHNTLVFSTPEMPVARAPRADPRPLRTGVYWLRLDAYPRLRPGVALGLGREEAGPYLGEGWGEAAVDYRWTVGRRAEVFVAPEDVRAAILRMRMHPDTSSARGSGQRVFVSLNGELAGTLALRDGAARVHSFPLPRGLRGADTIALELPDARAPDGSGSDPRALGVGVSWFRLDPFPLLPSGIRLDLGGPSSEPFLGDGWGDREGPTRWTTGLSADIFFAAEPLPATRLVLTVEPFLHGRLSAQRVRFDLNGQPLGVLTLARAGRQPYELALPLGAVQRENVLRLSFPDARSPASLGAGDDRRLLGLRGGAMELRP
jgi:hypothetical protein